MMYREQYSSSRMLTGLIVVAALHVAVIIAFKNGLVRDAMQVLPQNIEAYFIEDMQETEPPPPVEQLKIEQPVLDIQPIEMPEIELPPIEQPIEVATQPSQATPTQEVGTGEGPSVTEFKVDSRYPLTKPEYPQPSIRLQEEGSVTLLIYVLPNGRVGEAKVQVSSGYPRLDASAIREALKSWRFQPRRIGERAIAGWGTFKVKFQLDK